MAGGFLLLKLNARTDTMFCLKTPMETEWRFTGKNNSRFVSLTVRARAHEELDGPFWDARAQWAPMKVGEKWR